MIVAFHAPLYKFAWNWTNHIPPSFLHGVSFFFVLSGFVLTPVYSSQPSVTYGPRRRARAGRSRRLAGWPIPSCTL
ncbi:hypothetical protein [Cupriavidus necator]|uniref:hypothetical protein n=1 Tax=Cupriavidus necator TaxID=106590 RepID=UPI00359324C9